MIFFKVATCKIIAFSITGAQEPMDTNGFPSYLYEEDS
jgi:hypothetical protein